MVILIPVAEQPFIPVELIVYVPDCITFKPVIPTNVAKNTPSFNTTAVPFPAFQVITNHVTPQLNAVVVAESDGVGGVTSVAMFIV
jgi:hypothetical protein